MQFTLTDYSEYETMQLLKLIESKRRWLEGVPSGDPRRNRMISEINILEACWLKLEMHTNWVLRELDANFAKGFVEAMDDPRARHFGLNGYCFYWQIGDDFYRLGRERVPIIALKSNVPVHLPGMQIEDPRGDLFTPIDIIRLGGAAPQ